ncbi:cysteine hydrolase family protein [Microvirga thermotolerans]|uniref:Isochorismatase family protein n=1 Tax=Microvirga thermotolerans TaxID=2651334 RepID=A0A5P9JVZ1_9HYPH|nr:cysteine hydrolase family protein [Microvirga thermotolerans]QFU15600.1 isochorismatase family protein [Microvirga thermotolerans]
MSHAPKSLLEMAGASLQPGSFETSALILIDHQREYLATGGLPLVGIEAAAEEIGRLLAQARREGTPVFHVVHHARPGARLFDPDGPTARIVEGLEPTPGETVIAKSLPNAFAGTDLHTRLQAMGRRELIVAGFATHMCVSSTVRAALDLGYRTTVVAAATATRDLPSPTVSGGIVPADTVQAGALAALADRFAVVVPNAAALSGRSR